MRIIHARGDIQFPQIISRVSIHAVFAIGTVLTVRSILAIGTFIPDSATKIFIEISHGCLCRIPFASRVLRVFQT